MRQKLLTIATHGLAMILGAVLMSFSYGGDIVQATGLASLVLAAGLGYLLMFLAAGVGIYIFTQTFLNDADRNAELIEAGVKYRAVIRTDK